MTDIADVRERLARIETKLDVLVTVEPRVNKLEAWRNYMAGAIAVLVAAFSMAVRGH